jgi:hypothetical protein
MAGGQIDGFFKKAKPGQPLRALANVDNLNKVANIINDISGEGCTIEKPKDGEPWIIHVSDTVSDNEPLFQKKEMQCEVSAANIAVWVESNNRIWARNVAIYVNGLAVTVTGTLPYWWTATAGVKYMYILQHFNSYDMDADGQYNGNPIYLYATDVSGMSYENAIVAKIPYCRVEIPIVGEPPIIKNLLEGPLNLYCYRGDSETRAFAESPANPERQKPKSKTIDHSSGGELPLKVRNISAAADGYYNAYPNGRYTIESSSGSAEVVWNEPTPEQSKNNAKLLLLRYINKSLGTPHGLPYWVTLNQFLHNSETWIEDHTVEEMESSSTIADVISPWAWEIYLENPGPYEPKLTNDPESETQILAAVKDASGNWVTVADIVVMQSDLDAALEDWEDLSADAEAVVSQIENLDEAASSASAMADEAASSASAFTDYTAQAALAESEAQSAALEAAELLTEFGALDARITALEGQIQ